MILTAFLLIASWLYQSGPSMALQYALPPLAIAVAVLLKSVSFSKKDLLLVLGFAALVAGHSLFYRDTSGINPLMGLLTYSSALILVLRFKEPSKAFWTAVIVVAILSILEASIGLVQLLLNYGTILFPTQAAGDAVTGTLANNARVYFMKMFVQGIFLYYVWLHFEALGRAEDRRLKWLILAGAVFGLLGSVMTGGVAVMALARQAAAQVPQPLHSAEFIWAVWSVSEMAL